MLRIDDRKAGRDLMGRLSQVVTSSADPASPASEAGVSVAITFWGLKAVGVPESSLASFPPEFQQGMAARASILADRGESSPEHWEKPLGTPDVHVVLAALAPDAQRLDALIGQARKAYDEMSGIKAIWRQDCFVQPTEREAFGFRDGISHPAVEGSGIPGSNPQEPPLKAGEFVLGYQDESGSFPAMPQPEVLGRNGTYVVLRKLHQRVALFRQYLKANAKGSEGEELLAAKMMGRWRSGAPLALCPEQDDPELGADPKRNNDFLYYEDDRLGFKTPLGSHSRRTSPRDGLTESRTSTRIRRMIRRGTSYGPLLPEGVLEDDGADRGLMFVFIGANLTKQFEFVQSTWLNDGEFIGANTQTDAICGTNDLSAEMTIPRRPILQTIKSLLRFVVTRGGEYCFMPGLRALRWLADLDT